MLSCMSESHRDCLDKVMAKWREHFAKLKTANPKYTPAIKDADDVYGFAYWLIRWSGLVIPSNNK